MAEKIEYNHRVEKKFTHPITSVNKEKILKERAALQSLERSDTETPNMQSVKAMTRIILLQIGLIDNKNYTYSKN